MGRQESVSNTHVVRTLLGEILANQTDAIILRRLDLNQRPSSIAPPTCEPCAPATAALHTAPRRSQLGFRDLSRSLEQLTGLGLAFQRRLQPFALSLKHARRPSCLTLQPRLILEVVVSMIVMAGEARTRRRFQHLRVDTD